MSIKEYAYRLRLPYIRANYELMIQQANMKSLSYEQFLEELLKYELELRDNHSIQNRLKEAHFPYRITLDDFKRSHFSAQIQSKIKELETLKFMDNGENVILVGNPGTGKTALSVALGLKACLLNKMVLFISVPQLLIEMQEAMSKSQFLRYKQRFERYDLVIIDELGYSSFSKDSGEILFNLLSSRNENKSLIITSNLTMNRWEEVFKDKILTGAIVDRLANRAHMIDMSGDSYRIRQTREWMNEKKE